MPPHLIPRPPRPPPRARPPPPIHPPPRGPLRGLRPLYPSHHSLTHLLTLTSISTPLLAPSSCASAHSIKYPATSLPTLLPTLTATRTATRATCTAAPRTSRRRRAASLLSPLHSSRSPSICAERSDSGGQGEWERERERAGCCWEELGWMGVGGRKEKEEPVLLLSGAPGREVSLVALAGEAGDV